MERVESVAGKCALTWLQKVGSFENWARYKYEPSLHAPHTSSNFVESFNSTLGADRCLPVLKLLEGIRRTLMVRHCQRQEVVEALPNDGITDHAKTKLAKAVTDSRALQVYKASPTEYEVTKGQSALAVNIAEHTCGCGEWQIRGIPCRHAVTAIIESRGHPEHYVSEWYSLRLYKRAYSVNYRSVPDEEQWPPCDLPRINPPTMKRSRLVRCGRCKAYGHNVKTCKGGPTAREVREQGGIRIERRSRKKTTKDSPKDIQVQSVDEVMSSAPSVAGTQ